MRRSVGLTLIGLGVFFLALAPLVRFYVADRVVLIPLNRYNVSHLEAKNATYFDAAALKTRTGATLMATSTVRGDVRANKGDNDIAVWDSTATIVDMAAPDKPIQISGYRVAFDRSTARLVDCCGVNVDGDTNVKPTGYALLFPLANVQKRDYPFFDSTTKQVAPMRFDGEDKVHGLKVYRFVQQVPNTKTSTLATKLPGSMLGLGAKAPAQQVDRYSTATVTMWVDPRTGIPVKHSQSVHSTLQTPDGRGRMTVARADLVMIDKDQKSLVDTADDSALKISAVRSYVPLGSLFLGLSLLLLGFIVGLLGGGARKDNAPPPAPRRSDGKFGDIVTPVEPRTDGSFAGPKDGTPDHPQPR